MKTAKELFEELGYKKLIQEPCREYLIQYQRVNKYNEMQIITFNTSGRVISKDLIANGHCEGYCIFINELQAINKQIDELGWNDGKI